MFCRRLAVPLWALTFITAALTAPLPSTLFVLPPPNLFVIAVVGTAMIIFTMPGRGFGVAHASLSRRDSVAGRSIARVAISRMLASDLVRQQR